MNSSLFNRGIMQSQKNGGGCKAEFLIGRNG